MTPPTLTSLAQIGFNYIEACNEAFGAYFDSLAGIIALRENVEATQQQHLQTLRDRNSSDANIEFLDRQSFEHRFAENQRTAETMLHHSTIGEFKIRTSNHGQTLQNLSCSTVVYFYSLWEDQYREEIAISIGVEKNTISHDVFGELANLRNAIVHNNKIVTSSASNNVIFDWLEQGQPVLISPEQLDHIFHQIDTAITSITLPEYTS